MVNASELIAAALERSDMTRADLARALGISRSEVTARLRGERNITVRKLAATLHVLGERLHMESAPPQMVRLHALRVRSEQHFAKKPRGEMHAKISQKKNFATYVGGKSR